jgi:SAM-dependent methyltransferase
MQQTDALANVRAFWDAHPCGAHFVDAPFASKPFFEQYAAYRYRVEWHLPELVPFDRYAGKRVLEIGCGLGTDGTMFARNGALYTGVDLTPAAVEATTRHFRALDLPGRFLVQNAELLPDLDDASFDLVYSHGVLHHSKDISATFRQVHRVLEPGGAFVLMLYHRRSFNHYVRILLYLRTRALAYAALRPLLPDRLRAGTYETHYQNFRAMGWRYFRAAEFKHHCTDGPECPIANSYTKQEVRQLLEPAFVVDRFAVANFPMRKFLSFVPLAVERLFARTLGFYLFIYARKPVST